MAIIRKSWTHDELFIALNIYHKLTFGQLDHRNPVIIGLAEKLGRTPGSVSMKLCNLASFDPVLKLRGIKGLEGASILDGKVWNEFHSHLEQSVPASEEALRKLFNTPPGEELEVSPKTGIQKSSIRVTHITATEASAQVKQRRGQSYFRDAVLNNYGERCGVTQLAFREFLIASHILPWSTHPNYRLDVQNGICLSRLHDAAFDCGLITFDDKLCLRLSPRLRNAIPQEKTLEQSFGDFEGYPLNLPTDALPPSPSYLAEHRRTIFQQ
jgi:putative restriction endonuclease